MVYTLRRRRYLRSVCSVVFSKKNMNKMVSNYLPLSLSIIPFLSFCADKDNKPPHGLTYFLNIIYVYVLRVTVMTVTRYDLI
jgi:hypothetical protein